MIQDIDGSRYYYIKPATGIALADNNIARLISVQLEIADNRIKIFLVDIFKKRKTAQQVDNRTEFVREGILAKFLEMVVLAVFEPYRAATSAAIDHADRNFVTFFILDDQLGEVGVKGFAYFFPSRIGNDRGRDKTILAVADQGDGDPRERKTIIECVNGTTVIFNDFE